MTAARSVYSPMSGTPVVTTGSRPYVGQPRPFPTGWDERWQQALEDWMCVENLEERAAAPGWIDPRALAILRSRAAG